MSTLSSSYGGRNVVRARRCWIDDRAILLGHIRWSIVGDLWAGVGDENGGLCCCCWR